METPRPEREQIMVVETEHGHYGFVVDQVLGDHQTVIKNLGRLYRNVQVVSGATILGNGTVALILDPHRLVQNVVQSVSRNNLARPSPAHAASQSRRNSVAVIPILVSHSKGKNQCYAKQTVRQQHTELRQRRYRRSGPRMRGRRAGRRGGRARPLTEAARLARDPCVWWRHPARTPG